METAGKLLSLASPFQSAVAPEPVASPEIALIEAVRGGDREAFGRLYDLYAPMVHGVLLARVPYRDVDDLVQDVFLVALKRLSSLRDNAAFGGWLAMIARNRAVDYYRRARETEALSDDLPVASHRDTEAEHEAARMLEAVRGLPEAYRETLILRLVEGMTGPEIAARTGMTPASVRVNLHRGMKLLREKLGLEERSMKNDYLWDGSGEPDPDIEQLETLLGSYRHQARPLDLRIEQSLTVRRGSLFWVKYAAAAIILMAIGGTWWLAAHNASSDKLQAVAKMPEWIPLPGERLMSAPVPDTTSPVKTETLNGGKLSVTPVKHIIRAPQPERVTPHQAVPDSEVPGVSELAMASPLTNPFVDAETAKHIEHAQVLLRSFRNTEGNAEFDLAYERQSSRLLLSHNVLLRRDAEAKGNLPVQDLLGSLEPFLLDIANLPDAPSRDDVNTIKTRLEKKEIITALQVYSVPSLSRAF